MTTIKFPVPEAHSVEAEVLARMLSDRLASDGRPVDPMTVELVLAAIAEAARGPRYEAVALHYSRPAPSDEEVWVVRDRTTGQEVSRERGYFAGQDARRYALALNEGES